MLDILSGIVVRNINKELKKASSQGLAFFLRLLGFGTDKKQFKS